MAADRGSFIGYNADGEPIAVAAYGPKADTRSSAMRFASAGGLTIREFKPDDPELETELDKWVDLTMARAKGES